MSGTEQRGVCAGGKKPTARSINRILKLFESFKIRKAGRKCFFDTLQCRLQTGREALPDKWDVIWTSKQEAIVKKTSFSYNRQKP